MAFLAGHRLHIHAGRGRRWLRGALAIVFGAVIGLACAANAPETQEYRLKAVFLFNFSRFVDWPEAAFASADQPLAICVLGEDPFDSYLDEAVRGEKVDSRTLIVRRYRNAEGIDACQVLYIGRSEAARLDEIEERCRRHAILSVSDLANFDERGGMIGFVTESNHVRLRINVAAAKAAGLTISSKLLRAANVPTNDDRRAE